MSSLVQTDIQLPIGARSTPEFELLLQCLQISTEGPVATLAIANIEWPRLLTLAAQHGLSSVVSRALRNSEVPATVASEILQAERAGAQHGLRLTAVLAELTRLFAEQNIRAIAYKGPILSQQLFGDPSVRNAVDLDVVIAAEDLRKAISILSSIGFVPIRHYPGSTLGQLTRYRAEFGMSRDGVLVELQWRPAPTYFSFDFDFEVAWQNHINMPMGGTHVATFSPEENLMVLCVHGIKHHWEKLKWVLDVDLLVRQNPGLDWHRVLTGAEKAGTRRILLTSLRVCQTLLGTPSPSAVEAALKTDADAAAIAAQLVESLTKARPIAEGKHHRLMLASRERAYDRARYVARLMYQPTELEWDVVDLPQGLQWLYYPLRVVRVAGKALF